MRCLDDMDSIAHIYHPISHNLDEARLDQVVWDGMTDEEKHKIKSKIWVWHKHMAMEKIEDQAAKGNILEAIKAGPCRSIKNQETAFLVMEEMKWFHDMSKCSVLRATCDQMLVELKDWTEIQTHIGLMEMMAEALKGTAREVSEIKMCQWLCEAVSAIAFWTVVIVVHEC